ncbi:MAG: hypothetical protein K0V04_23335, partial [Deltaproteobacteria bacterium]|nr:hypothetical protein [Deltaproteobacteria bacterium]
AASGSSGGAATGSVNTSATITASGTAGPGETGDASNDTSGALDGTGRADSGTGFGTGVDTSGNEGSSSGGPSAGTESDTGTDGPPCVALEECTCDPGAVFCEAPPPECPAGQVPLVDEMTMCWDGACVPSESCYTVPDCSLCEADEACVSTQTFGLPPALTCQDVPPACMGSPTCDCMPTACDMALGFQCSEPQLGADEDLVCFCRLC